MSLADKFNIPKSLYDAVRSIMAEETEYQAKVKALMAKMGIKSLNDLSPEEKKEFFNTLDSMHKAKNEEVELDEGKSGTGYELYHKDFSSAMAHAYDFAKKKYNIEIDPTDIDRKVAMGPKKPSSGKANAYRLLDKTGKKAIQVQVTNLDNKRYELNMYKEEVELDEVSADAAKRVAQARDRSAVANKLTTTQSRRLKMGDKGGDPDMNAAKTLKSAMKRGAKNVYGEEVELDEERDPPFTPDKPKKNPGVVPGKRGVGPSIAKHLAKMALKRQQEKKQKSMKEEEEIDEVLDTPSKALGYLAKATLSGLKSGALGTGKFRKRQVGVNKAIEKTKSKIAKMNNEEVEELDEAMSAAQIKKLRDAYANIDKIDVSGQPYKNLVAFLDKQNLETLKMLAGAKIKFISGMAQNRVVRKMNESIGSTVGGALGQYAGSKMGLEGPGRAHGEVLGRQLEKFARELLKKLTKEEVELTESHFKVGQRVECIASGMKGTVTKLDSPEEGKYYTVKQDSGKVMKYAPDELKALSTNEAKDGGASKKKEAEFHKKLDTLVHKAFGKRPEEMKEAEGGGTSIKGSEANRAMATAQRAKLTMQAAQLRIKQSKEREALSKKKQAIKSEDVNDIFSEAMKKDKKDATAKDKNKVVKSGDKLSGKQEPIELQPELKEDKK